MSNFPGGYQHISGIVDDLKKEWDDIQTGKVSPVIECGIPVLKQYNLCPAGETIVVQGISGCGKSTLVFQILLGTAIDLYLNDKPGCVAVNSLEMTASRLVERMASILAQVDITTLRNNTMPKPTFDTLVEYAEFVKALPIFVDDTNFISTSAMQYHASGLHASKFGPVVQLCSDYGELFKEDDSGLTKEQRVDKVFREHFNLSRMIGASVIAISQSTIDTAVSGKSYIAGPDGTRYSRGILQSTDVLLELWNPVHLKNTGREVVLGSGSSLSKEHPYLLIQKRRSGATSGEIPLGWKPSTTTFFDMGIPQTIGKETVFTHLEEAFKKYKGNATW